eukprot:scaffold1430_cov257-Pinguiococcus_pyrenoidosus.AAC.15
MDVSAEQQQRVFHVPRPVLFNVWVILARSQLRGYAYLPADLAPDGKDQPFNFFSSPQLTFSSIPLPQLAAAASVSLLLS